MKLDLGGIAKGYASRRGHRRPATARGSPGPWSPAPATSSSAARPPTRDGWTIGIAPLEPARTAPPPVPDRSRDAAVSTSGDAERFVEIDGKRYSHIVDPRTGLGVVDRSSVTVVAPDGATADGLDTAVYVLGPERGIALVEETVWSGRTRRDGDRPGPGAVESTRWHKSRRAPEAPAQTPRSRTVRRRLRQYGPSGESGDPPVRPSRWAREAAEPGWPVHANPPASRGSSRPSLTDGASEPSDRRCA